MNEFIEQISPRSILSLFDTTKEQRVSFADQVIEGVAEGNILPSAILIQAKAMTTICEAIITAPSFKEAAIKEVSQYGKEGFIKHNAELSIMEAGTTYDYSVCNDPEIIKLQLQVDNATNLLKERQKFLKSLPEEGVQVVTDDGEVYQIHKPLKKSTTTIKTVLK